MSAAAPKFRATVRNQYGCPIGFGTGDTRDAAVAAAHESADRELRNVNRRWKWRKARTEVEAMPGAPA